MMIVGATFLKSLAKFDEENALQNNAIAFLGRSNVGKSSLINALCNHKGLAKSSSTPGKTQLINLFEISFKQDLQNFKLILIDLPGFGYAKVSKSLKNEWSKNLSEYLQKEKAIKLFIHLRDSRHFDLDLDYDVSEYLKNIANEEQSILEVFTKIDKLNQSQKAKLKNAYPRAIFVSNTKKQGLNLLNEKIAQILPTRVENAC